MADSPTLGAELPPLPEPYTVASTMRCVTCGAPYDLLGARVLNATANPFACVPTHACKCGSTVFGGTASYDSPSPVKHTDEAMQAYAREAIAADRASRAQSEPPETFEVLRALTEALLTRASNEALRAWIALAVEVMADRKIAPPVPWPDDSFGIAAWGTSAPAEPSGWRSALKFYAEKYHFMIAEESAWDTVSGEPANYWCDEAGTATVEDGTVAAMALAGTPLPDEDDEPATPGERQ